MTDATLAAPATATLSEPSVAAATECVECGAPGVRAYCAACGQPAYRGRFTLKSIFTRLLAGAFDLDRGLLFTALELSRRPGEAIAAYVAGRTVRYANPVKYYLVAAAITTVVYISSGAAAASMQSFGAGGAQQARAVELMGRYLNLVMALGLPFIAAASRLLFRRAGYNLAEHLIFNTFVYAQQCLIFVVMTGAGWLAGANLNAMTTVSMAAGQVYYAWAAAGFFRVRPFTAAWRSLAANLLGYAGFFLVVALGSMLAVLVAFVLSLAGSPG